MPPFVTTTKRPRRLRSTRGAFIAFEHDLSRQGLGRVYFQVHGRAKTAFVGTCLGFEYASVSRLTGVGRYVSQGHFVAYEYGTMVKGNRGLPAGAVERERHRLRWLSLQQRCGFSVWLGSGVIWQARTKILLSKCSTTPTPTPVNRLRPASGVLPWSRRLTKGPLDSSRSARLVLPCGGNGGSAIRLEGTQRPLRSKPAPSSKTCAHGRRKNRFGLTLLRVLETLETRQVR